MPVNHCHDRYEIYYLTEGERYYFIKDRTYHVKKGDLVLINVHDLHKTSDAGVLSHERILIEFREDFITNFIKDLSDVDLLMSFKLNNSVLRLNLSEQNFVEGILSKMISESQHSTNGSAFYLQILLSELLLFTSRFSEPLIASEFEYITPLHKKISEIVSFINMNYMTDLSLDHISKQFFISPFYLSRSFKDVTGFSFTEYINSVRVKEAQKLLKGAQFNITQITEKVGYESITHFGRVFKALTGVSPLQYRKQNQIIHSS